MLGWLYERPECLDYVHHQAPLVLANRESFLESFVSASCDFVAQFLTVFMPFLWLNTKTLRCSTIWTFITQKQRGLIQHLLFKTCQGTCGACYMFAALDSLSDRHCIDTTKVLRGRVLGDLQVVSRLLGMWTQLPTMDSGLCTPEEDDPGVDTTVDIYCFIIGDQTSCYMKAKGAMSRAPLSNMASVASSQLEPNKALQKDFSWNQEDRL